VIIPTKTDVSSEILGLIAVLDPMSNVQDLALNDERFKRGNQVRQTIL
jgi:hypothetical protein